MKIEWKGKDLDDAESAWDEASELQRAFRERLDALVAEFRGLGMDDSDVIGTMTLVEHDLLERDYREREMEQLAHDGQL